MYPPPHMTYDRVPGRHATTEFGIHFRVHGAAQRRRARGGHVPARDRRRDRTAAHVSKGQLAHDADGGVRPVSILSAGVHVSSSSYDI